LIRLNKYIADAGVCSRRKADERIASGAVLVNGNIVTEMGYKVDASCDMVSVDGKPIKPAIMAEYYLLYKPTGVVSTCDDPQGRKTVLDFIQTSARLYPVGRLDYETSGLLLLTNDGELTHKVTHPSFELEKEYIALVKGELDEKDQDKLQNGVYIDGQKTHPAKVAVLAEGKDRSEVQLVIHEGRNRQVRKMLRAVGHHVYALKRVRLGKLTLDGLQAGEYRELSPEEVTYLKGLTHHD